MGKPTKLTLSTIGGGNLEAQVNREITKLCDNIVDPNVPTDATRTITVKIKVKPNKSGQVAAIKYLVTSSLPGVDPGETSAFIAMDPETKDIALFGTDQRQQALFGENKEELVTEIKPQSQATAAADPKAPAFAPPLNQN